MTPRRARNMRQHQLGSDSNVHHARVAARPWHVVRYDGALLSAAASEARALETLAAVMRPDLRQDFARVERRGAR